MQELPRDKKATLLDKIGLNDCKKRHTNLEMTWMDCKKPYVMIPHSWIFGKSEIGAEKRCRPHWLLKKARKGFKSNPYNASKTLLDLKCFLTSKYNK